jgi:catechol 2,3-dioxygenase-like lactoylglutathione lyase family enzyme
MKTHLSFSTTNLAKSLEFYSTLLDARPAKALDDYALFITEAPGLELSLDVTQKVSPAKDAHYGLCVESVEDVERAIARLEGAGLVASIERQQTCCYANQTKVWAIDPDGRHWEVYTVHEETNERDSTECCDKEAVCCAC